MPEYVSHRKTTHYLIHNGYHLHHTATCAGYSINHPDYCTFEKYNGKYGEGYKIYRYYPAYASRKRYVEYWIKEES